MKFSAAIILILIRFTKLLTSRDTLQSLHWNLFWILCWIMIKNLGGGVFPCEGGNNRDNDMINEGHGKPLLLETD